MTDKEIEEAAIEAGCWAIPLAARTSSAKWNDATKRFARAIIAIETEQLRKSLARCLEEAEGWLDAESGCKPNEVMDYDGWADEARRLLGEGTGNEMLCSNYAKELLDKVIDKGRPGKTPARDLFEGLIDMLEPIIEALAELRFKTEWSRFTGHSCVCANSVPGVGPILGCEVFGGVVHATRSDGVSAVKWRSTLNGWEKED